MSGWLPDALQEAWDGFWEDVRDYFWDERRALLTLGVLLIFLGGLFYLTGGWEKTRPHLYLQVAKFQTWFNGPGDPEDTYTRVIAWRPDWGWAYYQRGLLREKRKDFGEALSDFEQASLRMPGACSFFTAHGRVAGALGKTDQALWDFQQALSIDPRDDSVYQARADLFMSGSRFEDALADYREAYRLAPESLNARLGIDRAQAALDQEKLRRKMNGE